MSAADRSKSNTNKQAAGSLESPNPDLPEEALPSLNGISKDGRNLIDIIIRQHRLVRTADVRGLDVRAPSKEFFSKIQLEELETVEDAIEKCKRVVMIKDNALESLKTELEDYKMALSKLFEIRETYVSNCLLAENDCKRARLQDNDERTLKLESKVKMLETIVLNAHQTGRIEPPPPMVQKVKPVSPGSSSKGPAPAIASSNTGSSRDAVGKPAVPAKDPPPINPNIFKGPPPVFNVPSGPPPVFNMPPGPAPVFNAVDLRPPLKNPPAVPMRPFFGTRSAGASCKRPVSPKEVPTSDGVERPI